MMRTCLQEQANRAKFLQLVSGANVYLYWASFFLWDYFIFMASGTIMLGALAAFGEEGWSSPNEMSRLFAMFAAFGFAAMPFTYLLGRCFNVPTAALTVLTVFYILGGLVLSLIVKALNDFEFNATADRMTLVFMVMPHFSLNRILVNLQFVTQNKQICEIWCGNLLGCTDQIKCALFEPCCGRWLIGSLKYKYSV